MYFPKGVFPKTIHDWHRPLRIAPYRAIIYASFSKRAQMTVTLSNFVNNTLSAYIYQRVYIRLPRRDQGTCIVYLFVGARNRHWGAFAKRCINNRTIPHDAKGAVPIVYCFRKMHLWGSTSHAVYSIPLCFYLGWSAYLETMSKFVSGLIRWGGFLCGTWEWFQRSYIIVTSCLWCTRVSILLT